MQKAQTNCIRVPKHIRLQQPHHPGIQPGYPKCIPDDSPVSAQQHDTYFDGRRPQKVLAGPTGRTVAPLVHVFWNFH